METEMTDEHRMNLIGLTSSLSELRTNAYMALILSVEGKTFSSWVRSVNRIRIVVWNEG